MPNKFRFVSTTRDYGLYVWTASKEAAPRVDVAAVEVCVSNVKLGELCGARETLSAVPGAIDLIQRDLASESDTGD